MKKRMMFAVVLSVLLAASVDAQTKVNDFIMLVRTGTPESVQAAIDQGANPNASDIGGMSMTPLISAAAYNANPGVMATLPKAGADIKAHDATGLTALLCGARYNNPKVVITLLKGGADIKERDTAFDMTPLMWAAKSNQNTEVITALLKAGADVKVKDLRGKKSLDYAQDNEKLKGTDALKQLEKASK